MAVQPRDTGRTVEVRLSQVPLELRRQVADTIIKHAGLRGVEALDFQLRAVSPRQDPVLHVSQEKAKRVLSGRLPTGSMPKVWEW